MTLQNDEYGRRALDFVADVVAATTKAEVCARLLEEMRWYGMDFVTVWSMPHVRGKISDTFDLNTRPEDYIERYNRRNLVARDPVVTRMRRAAESLSWSEVRERGLTKEELGILDEARDFGATDGLTVPVVSRSGYIGVFSPCGYKPDLSARSRAAMEMIGIFAHQALARIVMQDYRRQPHVPLTAREREVIRWVAVGKTNDEIGSILNVEAATVKTILSRAQVKLNASRRSYAVVQALRLGEIDLSF